MSYRAISVYRVWCLQTKHFSILQLGFENSLDITSQVTLPPLRPLFQMNEFRLGDQPANVRGCWLAQTGKVKVKESRNRPSVDQRVPGGLGSQISWHSAGKGGEVVNLTYRPPLPPGMLLVLIFTRGWVDSMERSEVDMLLQNPVTPPGIDPGTVRLVAQRLNHYATPGPVMKIKIGNRTPVV
jgi:hypothetical protein